MLKKLERYLSNQKFGKLELVDREIFYISFNTRDNWLKLEIIFFIISNTPKKSRQNSMIKKMIIKIKILNVNLIIAHNIITPIINIRETNQKGSILPNIKIPIKFI